jgi:hypothetical protein
LKFGRVRFKVVKMKTSKETDMDSVDNEFQLSQMSSQTSRHSN